MKSERITFLATPEFKADLVKLASKQNTSVGEVIRGRFERTPDAAQAAEENELRTLTADLRTAVAEAQASLREGLAEADAALAALHKAQPRQRAGAAA
jgi:guanylate kinase